MQGSEGNLENIFKLKSPYLIENTEMLKSSVARQWQIFLTIEKNDKGSLEAEWKSYNTDSQETFYTVLAE